MWNKLFLILSGLSIITFVQGEAGAETVASQQILPGDNHHLCIVAIENQTEDSSFKAYLGSGGARALILPGSVWHVGYNKIYLTQRTTLRIVCVKGAYETINIHDEGIASGKAPNGYKGPFYLSMWLSYPYVDDEQKLYVRYAVKKGKLGEISIRIDDQGNCQVLAINDVIIMH